MFKYLRAIRAGIVAGYNAMSSSVEDDVVCVEKEEAPIAFQVGKAVRCTVAYIAFITTCVYVSFIGFVVYGMSALGLMWAGIYTSYKRIVD